MKRKSYELAAKCCLALSILGVAGKVWLGVGAVAAANGVDWKGGVLIGALGLSDGVLYGTAMAAMGVSGPVGIAVAFGVGA